LQMASQKVRLLDAVLQMASQKDVGRLLALE
jgi:hypothetical protein